VNKEKETFRLYSGKFDLPVFLSLIASEHNIENSAICSGIRRREGAKTRKLLSQIAVRKMGYSGAEAARFLGITTSAANRLVSQEELPEVKEHQVS
jgi:hypothetical protein